MKAAAAALMITVWACGCGGARPSAAANPANAPSAGAAAAPARPAQAPQAPRAQSKTISIVATNDLHGRLEQLPLLGGYLHNLRTQRAAQGGGVLLLDAGDIFQGTLASNLTEGAAMVRAFNALGYAAVAVGNHEFDFGPVGPHTTPLAPEDDPLGALEARVQQARFPFLSANLIAKDGSAAPIAGVAPSVLLEVAGVRVGVIGGITKDALTQTLVPNVAGLAVTKLAEPVAREARALRARGAQLVIALVHAGGNCADVRDPDDLSGCDEHAEVFELARALEPGEVDLIVGGHTHAGVAHHVNGIPIIESYANGRAFGRVDFRFDAAGHALSHVIEPPHALCRESDAEPVCAHETYAGAPVQRDAAVQAAIAGDLERAREQRARPVGVEIASALEREHSRESALGNLVVDLMRATVPSADAAINNGGSIRTSLPAGPLRYGQLFEMFPFDNAVAVLHLPARSLAALIAANLRTERGFLSLSGLRAQARCAGGALEVTLYWPGGKRVAASTPLTVVTSDFLATGGDGLLRDVPLAGDAIDIRRDLLLRDALLRGFAHYPGGRIDGNSRALLDPAHPRVQYAGTRPVRCETDTP